MGRLSTDSTTPLAGTLLAIFKPENYGALGDGTTDDTAAILAADAAAAGVGVVLFTAGKTYKCSSALVIPFTGPTGYPVQKSRRWTSSVGSAWNGYWQDPDLTGTAVLDLRYAGGDGLHNAKIDTRGAGTFEIDHLTFKSGGSDNFPIFQTTNTCVFIHHNAFLGNSANSGASCAQDAVLLGGTTSTIGNGQDAPFQGYGSVVSDNFFSRIRQGVVMRTYANNCFVERNTFSLLCGTTGTSTAAIHILGAGSGGLTSSGNIVRDNLIETTHYPYAFRIDYGVNNNFAGNSTWDASGETLGAYILDTFSYGNIFMPAQNANGTTPLVVEGTPGLNTIIGCGNVPFFQFASAPVTAYGGSGGFRLVTNSGGLAPKVKFAGYGGAGTEYAATDDFTIERKNGPKLTFTGSASAVYEFFGSEIHSGQAANFAAVGALGTSDVWLDSQGSATNITLHLRAKGTGIIKVESQLQFNTAGQIATTATAGSGAALPATVQGYFVVSDNAGTQRKIPYYAV